MKKKFLSALMLTLAPFAAVAQERPAAPSVSAPCQGYRDTKPGDWVEFFSAPGGFSISTPGQFSESKLVQETPTGTIDIYAWIRREPSFSFVVGYSAFPTDVDVENNVDQVLDGLAMGMLVKDQVTVLESKNITLDGNPGRYYKIGTSTGKSSIRMRVFVANQRAFFMFVSTNQNNAESPLTSRFLDSFKISKPNVDCVQSLLSQESNSGAKVHDARVTPPPPKDPPPTIVRISESNLRGRIVEKIEPVYPSDAKKAKGDVVVEITVGEAGNVILAKVKSGPAEFHAAALEAAWRWRFKPATLDNNPIRLSGELTFKLSPPK